MILVVVNPISGSGNGLKIWKNKILPTLLDIFCENDSYSLFITDFDGHEKMIYCTYDVEQFDYIIVIVGDGTVSNLLKGFYDSKNNDEILKIPILIVPSGSGNGLSQSLNILSVDDSISKIKEIYLSNIKFVSVPIWDVSIDNNSYIIPAFLNITWSTIAEIDLNTENKRWMGKYRFYYGILKYLLFDCLKKGTLEFTENNSNEVQTVSGDFSLFCATNSQWLSDDFLICPYADIQDPSIDLVFSNEKPNILNRTKNLYYLAKGNHIEKCNNIIHKKVKWFKLKTENNDLISIDGEFNKFFNSPIEVNVSFEKVKFIV